jgi:cytochrome c5
MRGIITFFAIMAVLATLGCTQSEQTPASTKAPSTPLVGPRTPPEINTADAKFLFEIKCSLCHALDRPASKKMDYDEWLATIYRMKENGASVNDTEAEIIAAYLARRYGT